MVVFIEEVSIKINKFSMASHSGGGKAFSESKASNFSHTLTKMHDKKLFYDIYINFRIVKLLIWLRI